MDTKEIHELRRKVFREWVEKHYGSVNAFADSVTYSQPLLSTVLSGGKGFGEKLALKLERLAKMPPNSLVHPQGAVKGVADAATVYMAPTKDEVFVGKEWGKLQEPFRSQVRGFIEALVKLDMDRDRAARKGAAAKRKPAHPTLQA